MEKETKRPASDSDIEADLSIEIPVKPSLDTVDEKPVATVQGPTQFDFPDGGARAWSVAAGAAGVLFCTFGYANAFGVYQAYYSTHQLSDKTPSQISWIGSLQVFFLFMGNLFGGPMFDSIGAKVRYLI